MRIATRRKMIRARARFYVSFLLSLTGLCVVSLAVALYQLARIVG